MRTLARCSGAWKNVKYRGGSVLLPPGHEELNSSSCSKNPRDHSDDHCGLTHHRPVKRSRDRTQSKEHNCCAQSVRPCRTLALFI